MHIALLLPVTGSWAICPRIAGAAALAVTKINNDPKLLPRRMPRPSQAGRCGKGANLNLKVCDLEADGGCTLAECKAFCAAHAGFNCSYYSYEAREDECYLFVDCQDFNKMKVHYRSYRLDGRSFDDGSVPVIRYSWADSGCSAKQGLKAMGELLGGKRTVDVVIGPGCSSACEVTGYLTGGQRIPQISYSWCAFSFNQVHSILC